LGTQFGQPIILDGQAGFVPTSLIFQVAAGITLLAIIPLFLIKRKPVQEAKAIEEN
jgi:hypothetical protein